MLSTIHKFNKSIFLKMYSRGYAVALFEIESSWSVVKIAKSNDLKTTTFKNSCFVNSFSIKWNYYVIDSVDD